MDNVKPTRARGGGGRRWVTGAACAWAILFAAPHIWWALGISFGFPGGEDSYAFFMSSAWRVVYDYVVIVMSVMMVAIALTLLRPPDLVTRRWVPLALAWLGAFLLTLRGVAGAVVDGASDPVWWPTFLTGGILLGAVAFMARAPTAR